MVTMPSVVTRWGVLWCYGGGGWRLLSCGRVSRTHLTPSIITDTSSSKQSYNYSTTDLQISSGEEFISLSLINISDWPNDSKLL